MSKEQAKTLAEVRAENEELRARLQEAQDTLEAIQNDQVDALVVTTSSGEQVYTLKSAEQPYRVLVENMEEGAVTLLPEGTILYCNHHFAEMLKRPLEEVIGSDICDCFRPADRSRILELLEGSAQRGEFHVLASDESIVPVMLSPSSTTVEGITHLCFVVTDLSEQKHYASELLRLNESLEEKVAHRTADLATANRQLKKEVAKRQEAEEALQAQNEELQAVVEEVNVVQEELRTQNEELIRSQEQTAAERKRYEDLFHFAPDAYLTTDLNGAVQEANCVALGLLGVLTAEVTGTPLGVYVAEEGRGDFLTQLLVLRKPGARVEFELLLKPPSRPAFAAAISAATVTDAEGRPVGCRWLIRDIAERRRAEERLQENEQLLRSITDNSTDAIYVKDLDSRWLFANPALLRVVGRPAEDVLGRTDAEIYADKAIGQTILRNDKTVFEADEPLTFEETAPTREGLRVFLSTKAPRRDAEGRVVGLVGISRDITDRKKMEEMLKESKAAAESANAAKDHFLAVLSHELRTPLTPVLMMASAYETDPDLPEAVRQDMALVKRSVELEVDLIDDLLDLSRIAHGKLKLNMQDVDAHAKIKAAADVCLSEARERGLVLHTELAAVQSHVRGDGSRLQQVTWNLLKNAIKFTPRGGRVELRTCNPTRDALRIEVRDTGIGMEPEVIPRLFDAFEQGSPNTTRQFGGLGLGLAICKSLVEMHGGSIRAESAGPGKGATFLVELPAIPAAGSDGGGEAGGAAQREVRRSARVLLVEDHGMSADVLTRLLQRAGHKVKAAHSLQAALEHAAAESYDVLISDLGLPDGNGLDLIRQLRKAHPDLQAIALSGYGTENDVQRSKEAGFFEHLVKPVDFVTLRSAVERAINTR